MAQTSSMNFHGDSLYDQHLDLNRPNHDAKATNLFRNKDERRRLQGLVLSSKKAGAQPFQPKNLHQRIELWMINRGAKYLFLVVWIVLHLLVAIYGLVQYQMTDQFEFARRTFGSSYGQCSII
jgi:NADPH oxidase 2